MTRGASTIAVALIFACAACSRLGGSKDFEALESAYKAGVLSKEEYDVRKAAIQSRGAQLAALDRARAAGLLTDQEYAAKKSALVAAAPAPGVPVAAAAPAPAAPPMEPVAARGTFAGTASRRTRAAVRRVVDRPARPRLPHEARADHGCAGLRTSHSVGEHVDSGRLAIAGRHHVERQGQVQRHHDPHPGERTRRPRVRALPCL